MNKKSKKLGFHWSWPGKKKKKTNKYYLNNQYFLVRRSSPHKAEPYEGHNQSATADGVEPPKIMWEAYGGSLGAFTMTNYYEMRRQLTIMIEDRLREDGEVVLNTLYFRAQRNWGLGKKSVDKVVESMENADRIEIVDETIYSKGGRK